MGYWNKDEKDLASFFKKFYKYIARDRDGRLFLFNNEPSKNEESGEWIYFTNCPVLGDYGDLNECINPNKVFPHISWKDKKATLIEDILNDKQPSILDEVEIRYLKGVIRPFGEKVVGVRKTRVNSRYEDSCYTITIFYKDEYVNNYITPINLPCFSEVSSMYKGMEENKIYSTKELNIY